MNNLLDYYTILQIHEKAEKEVIEAAYKKLAAKYHPDINRSKEAEERMKQLNIAYEVLSDSQKRSRYDENKRTGQRGHQQFNRHTVSDNKYERIWRKIIPIASILIIFGLLRINPRIAIFAGIFLLIIYIFRSFTRG